MKIHQAISHVSTLKRKIEEIDKAVAREKFTGYGRPTRTQASVFVEDVGHIDIILDRAECLAMLEATKAAHEAEIAKLQPVIDMANAALKGVLS